MADKVKSSATAVRAPRPRIWSIVASSKVYQSVKITEPPKSQRLLPWQEKVWDHFDNIGEQRFGVGWQSNALSRVNIVAAMPPRSVGDEPTAISTPAEGEEETRTSAEILAEQYVSFIAGGPAGQGELLGQGATQLSIGGFGWMLAEPEEGSDTLDTWEYLAQDVIFEQSGQWRRRVGSGTGPDTTRPLRPGFILASTWRAHPRRPWEPTSPMQAIRSILELIENLTDVQIAQTRSRLAGNGVFAVPSEMEFPEQGITSTQSSGDDVTEDEEPDEDFDSFVKELMEVMTEAVRNRKSAGSIVPLLIKAPAEYIDKLKHITFWSEFDAQVITELQEAVKRLALGLDMPPEILTGMAGVNHWTAWQVEETAITLHVEPMAEMICKTLTEVYLRPALEEAGVIEPNDPNAPIVWYTTEDLRVPPDKSANAQNAYGEIAISGDAYRRELGFTEEDAPDEEERRRRTLLDVAKGAPTMAPAMMMLAGVITPAEAEQVSALMAGQAAAQQGDDEEVGEPVEEAPEEPAEGPPPDEDRPDGDRAAADGAVVAAADLIVSRALERAGGRLRAKVGKKIGGPQNVTEDDLCLIHVAYDASTYASLDDLLSGSLDKVPEVAEYLGVQAESLEAQLDAYLRALLANGHPHDVERLAEFV